MDLTSVLLIILVVGVGFVLQQLEKILREARQLVAIALRIEAGIQTAHFELDTHRTASTKTPSAGPSAPTDTRWP